MKAARGTARSCNQQPRVKSRLRAHQVHMYKLRREIGSVDCRLVRDSRLPVQFVLRRVGMEASRLSAGTRYCTITQREIRTAVQQLSHPPNRPSPIAGA